MNEQLAAIRTRRAAITPEQMRELRFMANCHNKAPLWGEFNRQAVANVLAALGDVDTLLAMVDALTGERDEARVLHRLVCAKFDEAVCERDALREQLQQAQRELAQERAIMNMVPEYIRYLAEWRAGDGRFLVFNEWVAQRVEQAQPQA